MRVPLPPESEQDQNRRLSNRERMYDLNISSYNVNLILGDEYDRNSDLFEYNSSGEAEYPRLQSEMPPITFEADGKTYTSYSGIRSLRDTSGSLIYVADIMVDMKGRSINIDGIERTMVRIYGVLLRFPPNIPSSMKPNELINYAYRLHYEGNDFDNWYRDLSYLWVEPLSVMNHYPATSSEDEMYNLMASTTQGIVDPTDGDIPEHIYEQARRSGREPMDVWTDVRSREIHHWEAANSHIMFSERGLSIVVGGTLLEFSNNEIKVDGRQFRADNFISSTMFGDASEFDLNKILPRTVFTPLIKNLPDIQKYISWGLFIVNIISAAQAGYAFISGASTDNVDEKYQKLFSKYDRMFGSSADANTEIFGGITFTGGGESVTASASATGNTSTTVNTESGYNADYDSTFTSSTIGDDGEEL